MPFDDALDTLYEPNAVSQFLESASMTFFSPFLSLLPLLLLLPLAFLVFLFVLFLSRFFFHFFLLFFPFISLLICSLFFFPIDLRLSYACVVLDYTTCNIYLYVAGFLGVARGIVGLFRRE